MKSKFGRVTEGLLILAVLAIPAIALAVPADPTNLTATPVAFDQINLAWTDNASDEADYTVERSLDDAFTNVVSAMLAANTTLYIDTNLTATTTYFYRVSASNLSGTSGVTEASATTLPAGTGLRGEYFNTINLGSFALNRIDRTVDFDWSSVSPDPSVTNDTYSVRWTGVVVPRFPQTYTFSTVSDDGVRLWINGRLVINNWTSHSATTNNAAVALNEGQEYDIRLEYFNVTGNAVIGLLWSSASQTQEVVATSQLFPASGLTGDYFDNKDLTTWTLTRVDPTVDFDWGTGSPDATIGVDTFSARWRGQIVPQFSETYTFTTVSDDGARLWVSGKLLVNKWINQAATSNSASIALLAGEKYDVQYDYFENAGRAVASLLWQSPSQSQEAISTESLYPLLGVAGEYYGTTNLTAWKFNRVDPQVNFAWQVGSPDQRTGTDNFSARWLGRVVPQYSETYTFSTVSDDGVRLWVNGSQLVNNWTNHGTTTNSGTIALSAGTAYDLKMEYFDALGSATAQLLWSSASQALEPVPMTALRPNFGLLATYYPNTNLTSAVSTQLISKVDFNWGPGGPHYLVSTNNFSARARGQVMPRFSQTYTFFTVSDDGVRLFVNGLPLINNWTPHGATTNTGTISLSAGQKYDINLEYFEKTGNAVLKLLWASPSQTLQIVPGLQLFPPTNAPPATPLNSP